MTNQAKCPHCGLWNDYDNRPAAIYLGQGKIMELAVSAPGWIDCECGATSSVEMECETRTVNE